MAKSTFMEQIRSLDDQKNKLLQAAKDEAMETVEQALAGLNSLGFNYSLSESKRAATGRRGTRKRKDVPCPICGFKTNPAHDGRAHRSQETKKPFSAAELKSRGFERA